MTRYAILATFLAGTVSISAAGAAEQNPAPSGLSPARAARAGTGTAEKRKLADEARLKEIVEQALAVKEAAGKGEETGKLDLPVDGRVTSTVGPRNDPINGDPRFHNGIDIAIPTGTPVTPVAAGKVVYSGLQPGYGNMVIVQHDDGMISIYAHHSKNLVKSGSRVGKETRLALAGSTGHSTGPHLHFEAWQGGRNVTSAFLPSFAGRRFAASSHGSLESTNLRKVIMKDGTILFVEVDRTKPKGKSPTSSPASAPPAGG